MLNFIKWRLLSPDQPRIALSIFISFIFMFFGFCVCVTHNIGCAYAKYYRVTELQSSDVICLLEVRETFLLILNGYLLGKTYNFYTYV